MADDEYKLFKQEMSDVVPLKREERVTPGAPKDERDRSLPHRRYAAVTDQALERNTLSDREIAPLDSWFVLEFKRPGVQNGVFRKLKQGRYEHEARLDMHRMTVAIARRELYEFIDECYQLGLRSIMLVHGKGERKTERENSAVLKGYVNVWLRDLELVQAFHSAKPQHGGTGAVYILLRKSEQKKRENRERFNKGRVPDDGAR